MTNFFEDAESRLELLQLRLTANKKANEKLAESFSMQLQENLIYIQQHAPKLYSKLIKHSITKKKIVCFENGEANLLDLKSYTLLYQESPIAETKEQVKKWLAGENAHIKSSNCKQFDEFCQLHFYIQNKINDEIDKFIETHNYEQKLREHEITQEVPLIVINGGGLGYPLLEICSYVEPKFIYYIEPDIEIFLCSLGVIDWASILDFLKNNNQHIHFIIGHNGNESFKLFRQQIKNFYPFLQSYQLLFTHYSSENTDIFLNNFKNSVSIGLNTNGMFDDALFGINNIIENTRKYRYLTNIHPQKFQNIPVAIIANGPSLDDDLEYLKVHQNNFIVVACGTAITALDKSDIIPDYYIDIERIDSNYKSLLYVNNTKIFEHTINISLNVVHPLGMGKFVHSLVVDKGSESVKSLFSLEQLDNVMTCSNTNPLVANGAISIFLSLSFNKIFLFGVDNGAVSESKIHSCKSLYFTNKDEINENETMKNLDADKIAGNFGNNIMTNTLFNECRHIIETTIQEHPNSIIYNCSNGAFIKGAIPIHSYELKLDKDITKQKNEYMQYILSSGCTKINLDSININNLYDKGRFNEVADNIIKDWSNINTETTKLQIIDLMKSTVDYLSQDRYKLEHSLFTGTLTVCFVSIIQALYIYKDYNLNLQLAGSCISQMITFLKFSKEIYKNAEKIIQGKHFCYEPKIVYDTWKLTEGYKN